MLRRSTLPLLVAALAILSGLAVAPTASASILIGQSIAGIALGDSKQRVEQVADPLSYSRTTSLFHPRREGSLHIHFTNGKVDLVGLFAVDGQQTATGIEIGSTRSQFKHAYPHAHCTPDGLREALACYITAHFRGYKTHTEFRFSETGQLEEIGLAYTLGPDGPVRIATAPGIQVTGQLSNLTLCTPYSYTVSVVPSKSYREAVLTVNTPAATQPYQPKRVNLKAGHRWTGSFTLHYNRPTAFAQGLQVAVSVLPPHHGYVELVRRHYALSAAPGQGEETRPIGPGCGPVPKYFGS